tara:strand:- start:12570 stop:12833 length:264 start_codon:yes stop_codon:yes gene_type:complete
MCRLAQLKGEPESLAGNPCIGWCTTRQFGDERCKGCGRLETEIRQWQKYTNIEKKLINIRNAGDGFTIRQCVPTGWRPTPINGTIHK